MNEIGELTNFNEIKSSEYFDLLKYLIRYGYIDETYNDYMTYFMKTALVVLIKHSCAALQIKSQKNHLIS